MPKVVAVIRVYPDASPLVFFDGPVHIREGKLKDGFTFLSSRLVMPEGATHYWHSEAGDKDYDPNGFTDDELGAFLWGQWVISMQDEWSKNDDEGR